MSVLTNRAYVFTSTTGTGTVTLGTAVGGFQTFAGSGVSDGDQVRYTIEDGANFEIGLGTYTASGTTLSRNPSESSNSDSAISLSGNARVLVTAAAEDIYPLKDLYYENNIYIVADRTLAAAKNTMSAGPITIATGVTVTIPSGATWTVVS